jgi:uncharacterized protein YbjT (DUF2867 family)
MTSRMTVPSAFMGALSVVAVATAACSGAPAAAPRVAQIGVSSSDPYPCYFADGDRADRVVAGRTLHWCGPVPRAVQ